MAYYKHDPEQWPLAPYANVEVFRVTPEALVSAPVMSTLWSLFQAKLDAGYTVEEALRKLAGWHWWARVEGRAPESGRKGPFKTESEARDASRGIDPQLRPMTEIVFGLTGGELEDEPWAGNPFWYEGTPEYCEPEDRWSCGVEYRTVVGYELFGCIDTPEGWERIQSFASSGEAKCLCEHGCRLCEGESDEDNYIYLGDGYTEIVYRRTLPEED